MSLAYFAYGSNLCVPRLRHRVPGARLVAPAILPGWEPRWHKRGSDASGKMSIVEAPSGSEVWGALFVIPAEGKRRLDRIEGLGDGYERIRVTATTPEGTATPAWTYVAAASHIDEGLRPYTWYRDLVLTGVEALPAPAPYVRRLRAVEAKEDPDPAREASERRFLT